MEKFKFYSLQKNYKIAMPAQIVRVVDQAFFLIEIKVRKSSVKCSVC